MSMLKEVVTVYVDRTDIDLCTPRDASALPSIPTISLLGGAEISAVRNFLTERNDFAVQIDALSQMQLALGIFKPFLCLLSIVDKIAGTNGIIILLATMRFSDAATAVFSTDTTDPGLLLLLADCFSGLIPQTAVPKFMVSTITLAIGSLGACTSLISEIVASYQLSVSIRAQVPFDPELEETALCYEATMEAQMATLGGTIEPVVQIMSILSTLVAFVPGLDTALSSAGLSLSFANPLDPLTFTTGSEVETNLTLLSESIDKVNEQIVALNSIISVVGSFIA